MVKLDEKVLHYAKNRGLDMVVDLHVGNSGGWCGVPTRRLRVESEKNFEMKPHFDLMEYEGVKIYIHKGVKLKDDPCIFQWKKFWFFPPIFGVKGMS